MEKKSSSAPGESLDQNSIIRMRSILFLITTIYPAWYLVVNIALSSPVDPLMGRLAVAFVALVSLLGSFVSGLVRKHLEIFLLASSLTLMLHVIYLCDQNQLNYVYVYGSFLSFFVLGIGFETLRALLTYLGICILATAFVDGADAQVHKVVYLAVFSTAGVTSLCTSWTRIAHAKLLRRNAEELEQANVALQDAMNARTALFANISHELRTPLSLILGHAEAVMESSRLDASLRQRIETINRNANVLITHVKNILVVAKSESGGLSLHLETFDAGLLMRAHIETFMTHAKRQGIDLDWQIPGSIVVILDAEKFEGIFVNLLSNAIKYTPFGGRVRVRAYLKTGECLQIEIDDSGPGIHQELREKIFERFYRIDDQAHHIGGTGLGLAITRQFSEVMRGTVNVNSSDLGGARFVASLPLKLADTAPHRDVEQRTTVTASYAHPAISGEENNEGAEGERTDLPHEDGDRFTLLFVEDHPELLSLLRTSFSVDFHVLGASNGEEALACLAKHDVDVICSDIMMPVMNGRELFDKVRADPDLASIPFIFLTARDDEAMRRLLLRQGAQDFIAKPVDREVLRSRILSKLFLQRQHVKNLEALNRKLKVARDAAVAANEAKSLFLANISHELRTPLTAIGGFAEILRTDADMPIEKREYVETISRNTGMLARIIDDLLMVTKLEAGRFEIEANPFPIERLVEDLTIAARKENPCAILKIARDPALATGAQLVSDYTRIFQVLANLIRNAVKFSNGQEVELQMEWERADREDLPAKIICEITDQGIGIARKDQERLFQPFGQVDNSLSRKFGGTGLGLFLSQRIARAMGGDVQIKSSIPGKGSTFQACFQVEALIGEKKELGASQGAQAKSLSGLTGIVIEDSADQQFLIEMYLKAHGADAIIACNGREGIDLLERGGPCDFVIMDVQMPELDGIETTRRLRLLGFDIPIIILTAHGLRYEEKVCLRAGADRYLAKPVGKDRLISTITTTLANRKGADLFLS